MENLKKDIKNNAKKICFEKNESKIIITIKDNNNKVINTVLYSVSLKNLIKFFRKNLNLKLSENVLLSDYFMEDLILNRKMLFI